MASLKLSSPRLRRVVRIGAGVIVVAAIVATVGTGPFIHGVTSVSWFSVTVAVVLIGVATASAVWRWRTVASGLGLELSWRGATAAYYRSQFLNAVLPGGVVGDVDRAYRHGRRSGSVALAVRAVATERTAGQVVQFVLVAVVLSLLGLNSPLHAFAWVVGGVAGILVIALAIVAAAARGRRLLRRELLLLGQLFGNPHRSVQIVASSIMLVASHATLFIVACVATGVHAPLSELVALALIVLTAAALPFNVGGWGPREGAAASAFAAAGLGAAAGVAASTTFGVLATIALLPGAVVLVAARTEAARKIRRASNSPEPEEHITELLIEEVHT
jgi:uncharacterized membrane protein YbhN (UPF0104 family)